jgi:hypothetical protein
VAAHSLVGGNKNAAANYRRLCTKFEYPPKQFPRIVALFIHQLGEVRAPPSNIDMEDTSSDYDPDYPGPVKLLSYEVKWRNRQLFLESKGYMLRPRLRPGWTPSWLSTGQDYESCEDSARLPVS